MHLFIRMVWREMSNKYVSYDVFVIVIGVFCYSKEVCVIICGSYFTHRLELIRH